MSDFALIVEGKVWCVEQHDAAPQMHPEMVWIECTGNSNAVMGASYEAGVFVLPAAPSAGPRYVKMSLIRTRLTERRSWEAFTAALDQLPADKRWHLLTLEEGVLADDPEAIGLLTAIGEDPTLVLAP